MVEKFVLSRKQWVLGKIAFFKNIGSKQIRRFSQKDYLENKEAALALALERIEHYSKFYGFSPQRVLVKNQKTRWGSCSHRGNLNFNYKILFLPQNLRDYIVVHELCHLKELNHSRKFWQLVAKAIPDYADTRKDLRNHELFYK